MEASLRVEGYEVLDLIGAGSFAEVYSAKALDGTNRLVAIKVLKNEFSHKPFYVDRFNTEARALAAVNQTGVVRSIVSLIGVSSSADQRPCIIMAYAANGSLFHRLAAKRSNALYKLDHYLGLALKVVDTLEEGCKAIHRHGFVHRDLKPGNLLIFDNGDNAPGDSVLSDSEFLAISDFGLTSSFQEMTLSSELVGGSRNYMAPETADPSHTISPTDDFYSATVTILYVLTGQPLSDGWEQRASGLQIPERVIKEIKKGTDDVPANRHSSIAEWANSFRSALSGKPNLLEVPTRSTSESSRPLVSGDRKTLLAILGGATVVGSVVVAMSGFGSVFDGSTTVDGQGSVPGPTDVPSSVQVGESPQGPEVEPFDGSTESCTIYFDKIPEEPLFFADIGEGGFVPGEGDCGRVNIWSLPNLPIGENWGDVEIATCRFNPVSPETHPKGEKGPEGDYRAFAKTSSQEEEIVIDHGKYDFEPGTTIEYVRLELSESLKTPEVNANDYLGLCSLSKRQDGFATELNFNLDEDEKTYDSPKGF